MSDSSPPPAASSASSSSSAAAAAPLTTSEASSSGHHKVQQPTSRSTKAKKKKRRATGSRRDPQAAEEDGEDVGSEEHISVLRKGQRAVQLNGHWLLQLVHKHLPSFELQALMVHSLGFLLCARYLQGSNWVVHRSRLLEFGWWDAIGVQDPRTFFMLNMEVYEAPPAVSRSQYCQEEKTALENLSKGLPGYPFQRPSEQDPWCYSATVDWARTFAILGLLLALLSTFVSFILVRYKKLPTWDGRGRTPPALLMPFLSATEGLILLICLGCAGGFIGEMKKQCPVYVSNLGSLMECVVPGTAIGGVVAAMMVHLAFTALLLLLRAHEAFERFRVSGVRVDSMIKEVQAENIRGVLGSIVRGIQVNVRGTDGRTALHWASILNRRAIVQALLQAGADPNILDTEGWTSLHHASREGHADVVHLLAMQGASTNARVKDATSPGLTALMLAAAGGHDKVIEALLAAGASVDEPNRQKQTALMLCAEEGHKHKMVRCAQVLLRNGANPGALDAQGNTTLHYAATSCGGEDMLELLLESCEPGLAMQVNKNGETALELAWIAANEVAAEHLSL